MTTDAAMSLSAKKNEIKEKLACGIVMPISSLGECSENHWSDVLHIITEAVDSVGFEAKLVSNADEVTVIQKTIVQNLYASPIVICDVSGKNANVMFELGMRLAFNKPTIVIKDDKTSFSFDMGVIEHLEYPRDLRFSQIVDFKRRLGEKVKATYEKSLSDADYSTFLGHFGTFKVASLEQKEVSGQEYIIEQLANLEKKIDSSAAAWSPKRRPINYPAGNEVDICCGPMNGNEIEQFIRRLMDEECLHSIRKVDVDGHSHLFASGDFATSAARRDQEERLQEIAKRFRSESRRRRLAERKDSGSKGGPNLN